MDRTSAKHVAEGQVLRQVLRLLAYTSLNKQTFQVLELRIRHNLTYHNTKQHEFLSTPTSRNGNEAHDMRVGTQLVRAMVT